MNIRKFPKKAQWSAITIPAIYSVFGLVYICLSYGYVRASLDDFKQIELLNNQVVFRLIFILLSSVLIHVLIRFFNNKLQSGYDQYLKLFRENPHPMWIFDTETLRFLAVNQAAIEKYGYSHKEFLSKTIEDIRPVEDVDRLKAAKSLKPGFNLSGIWKHQLNGGKLIDVEISTHTIIYEGRSAKLTLAYDVTDRVNYEHHIMEFNHELEKRVNERTRELHEALQEQAALTEELETSNEELISTNERLMEVQEMIHKQTESKIKETEYRLEQVLQSVKDFVWTGQFKEGNFLVEMMSPAVNEIHGFTAEEYFQTPSLWFSTVAEEDQERVKTMLKYLGRKAYEEIEYCVRHPKTWQVKYVLSRIWVSRVDETTYQLTGIISDVSERKKQEEEKSSLIKQLINQNNDLLQFSYIASHNLRGPVATLLGLIHLIEKEEKPSDIKAISSHLLYSTRKLDDVIIDLTKILETRDLHSLPRENTSLSEIIDNINKSLFLPLQNNNAQIITDFSAVDSFFTIKTYLYSILYNLISNGLKYRSPDRPVIIRISTFKKDSTFGIRVTDNGLGLELEKFRHKLFKLYQRFHAHVDGKGLGLYLVKTQTIALGGEIEVDSVLGEGTTFTVTFPVHHEMVIH